jgi:hypothetical protein
MFADAVSLGNKPSTDRRNVGFRRVDSPDWRSGFGRLPPDGAADREAREAATGSDELHST